MITSIITILLVALVLATVHLFIRPKRQGTAEFANVAEGETTTGNKTYAADAAIGTRFFCVEIGSDADHVDISDSENDIPLGICTDEAAAAEEIVNVQVFGAVKGTIKGIANASISLGDMLVSAGNGKLKTLPVVGGTYYIVGRALNAPGGDGEEIEFAPCFPIQRVVV